ncbi:MAG: hypothetical protein FJW39_10860 [Acidobacteria bacterium]|nr:hypothetical protein [Acidobacteriota bacterium]
MHTSAILCAISGLLSAADVPPAADQIAAAIQAAPKDRRDGVAVLGYSPAGKVVTLRPGKNELICLADNPRIARIEVACYHKDLEPFMARGRELNEEGSKGQDRHKQRWKEVDDGKVKMPREPRMLYVMTGESFDASTGTIVDSYLRWVVYTPYATPESIGLTTKSGNEPWIMYPGTAGAHIMISPPKPPKK